MKSNDSSQLGNQQQLAGLLLSDTLVTLLHPSEGSRCLFHLQSVIGVMLSLSSYNYTQ